VPAEKREEVPINQDLTHLAGATMPRITGFAFLNCEVQDLPSLLGWQILNNDRENPLKSEAV
jgi:hypothetical protein